MAHQSNQGIGKGWGFIGVGVGFIGVEIEIKLQMRGKMELSQETSPNSPSRLFPEHFSKEPQGKYFIINGSTNYSTPRMSETQSEIYSHRIIREVMEASRAKSIWHDINRVDEESQLYCLPLKEEPREFHIDSIPPKNELFLSACSTTIKNINTGLINHPHRVPARTNRSVRPASASSKIDTHNKKVSVSGLVTYNFNSLLAKKSLGFNQINHEENLLRDTEIAQRKLTCSRQRAGRILAKSSGQRFQKSKKNEKVIMSDFESSTDSYLKNIIAKKQENSIIFNQRAKKINCVKEYMENEKVDYDLASHAVNIIENSQKQPTTPVTKISKKMESEDHLLQGRRLPVQRKPVLIRHFHFIE